MTQQTLFSPEESPEPKEYEKWQFPDNKKALEFANGLCQGGKYVGIQIIPVESGKPDRIVKAVRK
ncbi:MAG TPA: hypothetical protein VN429_10455 [Methanospirillum sp.]|uniref:hypothetical protein n=1 Tax=Methanospirillum sp. TaxID=45200 RepID=UPI002B750456|nr:hypothetical protein [Methanospirillum sp.]HWQ64826.1 hypothetical protein [Methanospirillum sp.]